MGQYWMLVNWSKGEFVHPHKLGTGLKLWEQLANHPGTGAALIILLAAMPEPRGGGDLDLEDNWHGPERTFPEHNVTPGPMPEAYPAIAKRTIGRWVGDKIALVGDYGRPGDLPDPELDAAELYGKCRRDGNGFTDISDDVIAVIEHELDGKYVGDGWRDFKYNDGQGEAGA